MGLWGMGGLMSEFPGFLWGMCHGGFGLRRLPGTPPPPPLPPQPKWSLALPPVSFVTSRQCVVLLVIVLHLQGGCYGLWGMGVLSWNPSLWGMGHGGFEDSAEGHPPPYPPQPTLTKDPGAAG